MSGPARASRRTVRKTALLESAIRFGVWMTIDRSQDSTSRSFLFACAVIGAAIVAIYVSVASREWFFGDDFIFLRLAQAERDWWQVFFPLVKRSWWSYRPITIDVYFTGFFAAVGFRPLTYLLASLAVHFATGALVYRLAVQLGFDRRVALVSGLLSVSMYSSAQDVFWASAFQHVGARFFYLLAVSLFLDFRRRRRLPYQLGSCAAMLATLMCNELGVTLAGILVLLTLADSQGGLLVRVSRALLDPAPQIAMLAVYVPFRWVWMAPAALPMNDLYLPAFGWHILRNVVGYLYILVHEHPAHLVAALVLIASAWAAVRQSRVDARQLGTHTLLLGAWLLAVMVPFVGTAFAHPPRWAMIMEAPFCLLIGAHLDVLWSRWGARHPRVFEAALLCLVLVALPAATLQERAREPLGAINRDLVAMLEEHHPKLPVGGCVSLRVQPSDQWKPNELWEAHYLTWGLLGALHPDRRLHLEIPKQLTAKKGTARNCVTIELLPGPAVRWPGPRDSSRPQ